MPEGVGPWAEHKLDVLGDYLKAYAIALSNQSFRLVYIDAFAGSGSEKMRGSNIEVGSPLYALEASRFSRGFDRYYFFEQDQGKIKELNALKRQFPQQKDKIHVQQGNANYLIRKLADTELRDRNIRGLAFLDPYGAHVEWATIEALANTTTMEIIINFPDYMAINRLIPKIGDVRESDRRQLDQYFGTGEWLDMVRKPELDLFGYVHKQSEVPMLLLDLYQRRLRKIFKFVGPQCRIRNTRNAPLYLLLWAGHNERGATIASDVFQKSRQQLSLLA